jgi:chemotaxis protein MotB
VAAGMPLDKLARVVGMASSDLLLPEEPRAAQNRRITITVLTKEAERRAGQDKERSMEQVTSAEEAASTINQPKARRAVPSAVDKQSLDAKEEFVVTNPEVATETVEKPDNARPMPRG